MRPNLLRIAEVAILGTAPGASGSFTAIGASLLPKASTQEHIPAGKGALVLVIRELLSFYASLSEASGKRRRRQPDQATAAAR